MSVQVDLSRIPVPDAIEVLAFETILSEITDYVTARVPDLADDFARESSMVSVVAQVLAYRELLVRQRVNDGVRACMLPSAQGADLDNLAALFGVTRLVLDPGDAAAIPPVPAILETDTNFRARVQLAPESWTSAGSIGAYTFHALSADADVKDVAVSNLDPGEVTVSVLSRTGRGTPTDALVQTVTNALSAEDVRPLCDTVFVESASVVDYQVVATLYVEPGPDGAVIVQAARDAVAAHVTNQHRLGRSVTLSAIYAALHRPGVTRVDLSQPVSDILVDARTAPFAAAVTVTDGGVDV